VFYAGLWLTVRALPQSRSPWLIGVASLVARMGAAAGAFVLAAWLGGWTRAVALLAGFIAARVLLVRTLGGGSRSRGLRGGRAGRSNGG
jgi:F1F0 ATPase subunit 2